MFGIVIAWAFGSFLYFKVLFDAVFRADLSIIAALIMAIFFGGLIFSASGIYAMLLLPFNWSPGRVPAKWSQLIGRTLLPLVGFIAAYGLIYRLVIFAFSKKLSREIRIFDFRYRLEEEIFQFLLIITVPVIIHYAMCIFSTYNNANRNQDPRDDDH